MTLQSIASQPVTQRQLVNYVRPQGEGADQTSLRSLLAAAGFPAGEGAAALTEQVRRFQRSEIAAGRSLAHGADGKAGPQTLNALREVVRTREANSENPNGLADPQANTFVGSPGTAPRAEEVLRGPPPGTARVGGDGDAARRALEGALRQRTAEQAPPTEAVGAPPPTASAQIRQAHENRSELTQVRNQLRAMEREPRGAPAWTQRAEALQAREDALVAALAGNPQAARFDDLERSQRELADARRLLSGWAGAGRSRPEAERRVAAAESRANALASELGYLP